jgi:hypothetical protein
MGEQTVGLVVDPMGAAGDAARERLAEALGGDDHILFIEQTDIPEHWRSKEV